MLAFNLQGQPGAPPIADDRAALRPHMNGWDKDFPVDRMWPTQRTLSMTRMAENEYRTAVTITTIVKGKENNLRTYIFTAKRLSPFVARLNICSPEGEPLNPQFADYLRSHGMSSLIPEQGPQ